MPLFWTETDYLLALTAWIALLGGLLVGFLKLRRHWRHERRLTPRRTLVLGVLFALWSVLAVITFLEVVFVVAVDHSDAFNGTNVSKRWFRRYIDAQRNDDGFRDRRTLSTPLPPGTRRIVVFGDSYVAGHGLKRMEDRFTERLERAFNADGQERIWVLNLGEPGYEVTLIEGLVKAVLAQGEPVHLVLYCYMLNDIEGYDPRTEEFLREINRRQPTHPLITRTYFLNWIYFRWQQLQQNAAVNYFPHLVDSYQTAAWQGVDRSLTNIHEACRAAGVEFRLVLFPFMQGLGPESPFLPAHRKLAEWAQAHGVPCLDMEPLLSAHRHEPIYVNAFDSHPNEYAHQLISQALYEWLQQDPRWSVKEAHPPTTAPAPSARDR